MSRNELNLSKQAVWAECHLVPGATYRLRALIQGTPDTADKAALICFDVADRNADGGEGLAMSATVGPYIYLRTGDGLHRTDRIFTVASPAHRIGLMAWGNRGTGVLRTLTIETVEGYQLPADFFFSFDVEAAAERAAGDPIDTLVWGKIDGQEYGLRRICDVLEQHRIVGNFLIDFATCTFEGDHAARHIVEFLASRGHEVHMHLHPGWLAEAWGLRIKSGLSVHFDSTPYEMSRRLLDFTVAKYEQFVGQVPRLFRSGAYRINPNLVLAAGALGIEALSNVRGDAIRDAAVGGDIIGDREPFVWDNGVVEIPVDVSSPEAGSPANYLRRFDAAMKRKRIERTFNVVMHSWSLMRRNTHGIHDRFAPEYEQRLHQICEHANQYGKAYGYGDYLDEQRLPRPIVPVARIRTAEPERLVYVGSGDIATCNICDMMFARSKMTSDSCPSCGLGSRHRVLRSVLDDFGNVFDGRRVLAYQATPIERRAFLVGALQVVNVGRPAGFDLAHASVIETTALVKDECHDCFLGLNFLGQVTDRVAAKTEILRVLKQGGIFVSAEPHLAKEVLSDEFIFSVTPGLDPVIDRYSNIVFAYAR